MLLLQTRLTDFKWLDGRRFRFRFRQLARTELIGRLFIGVVLNGTSAVGVATAAVATVTAGGFQDEL